MNQCILAFLLCLSASFAVADEPAIDTLLKDSPVVVVAEPVNPPLYASSCEFLVKFDFSFRIKRILKSADGALKPGDIRLMHLAMSEFDPMDSWEFSEGEPVILFLRKNGDSFENTSVKFGVRSYSKRLERFLEDEIARISRAHP